MSWPVCPLSGRNNLGASCLSTLRQIRETACLIIRMQGLQCSHRVWGHWLTSLFLDSQNQQFASFIFMPLRLQNFLPEKQLGNLKHSGQNILTAAEALTSEERVEVTSTVICSRGWLGTEWTVHVSSCQPSCLSLQRSILPIPMSVPLPSSWV
jgi:hypothetical protein